MNVEPLTNKTSKAVESLRKVGASGQTSGSNHKKRFYNSMVVSGMLQKEQTPKVSNHSVSH